MITLSDKHREGTFQVYKERENHPVSGLQKGDEEGKETNLKELHPFHPEE